MTDLVVFAVDGTLLDGYMHLAFLSFVRRRGLIGARSYFRILAWFVLYRLGVIRDPRRIVQYAFGFLRGRRLEDVGALAAQCFECGLESRLYTDALRILAQHVHAGRHIVLLSTVPEVLVRPLGERLGTDVIGTRLECRDGVLTGRIDGPVLTGALKLAALQAYLRAHRPTRTFGYGNDASDVAFLSRVDCPHAVNPDRALARAAERYRWPVLHFDALGVVEGAR
jgi:HAD superfamily hydrolase (TIGR01490 family)